MSEAKLASALARLQVIRAEKAAAASAAKGNGNEGCDHTIGVRVADDGGFIRASEVAQAADAHRHHIHYVRTQNGIESWGAKRLEMSDIELVRDQYDMFAFCPDCGAKLESPT